MFVALGIANGPAAADHGNGALTFTATCDGPPLTFVDEASGTWASVKASGMQATFIPTSLTLNGHRVASHPATAPLPEVTCTTTSHPEGTLTGFSCRLMLSVVTADDGAAGSFASAADTQTLASRRIS